MIDEQMIGAVCVPYLLEGIVVGGQTGDERIVGQCFIVETGIQADRRRCENVRERMGVVHFVVWQMIILYVFD